MTKPNDKEQPNVYLIAAPILAFQFGMFGLLGILFDSSNRLSGFLWGIGIAIALAIACVVGYLCWEWIKKEADKGKLLPFMLIGFVAAIAISGLLAVNLGKPSCDESGDPPYSSCTQYADDGFETTSTQKWNKFWGTLPVTVIITSLVAVIVRNEMEKNKKRL